MFKSTDAGKTWRTAGMSDAGQIDRIFFDPSNPNVVFVAALGHAFGPNAERGVFQPFDGGHSWEKMLFVSDRTGAVDLAMAPQNRQVIYAVMWTKRKPSTILSGSKEDGLSRGR